MDMTHDNLGAIECFFNFSVIVSLIHLNGSRLPSPDGFPKGGAG